MNIRIHNGDVLITISNDETVTIHMDESVAAKETPAVSPTPAEQPAPEADEEKQEEEEEEDKEKKEEEDTYTYLRIVNQDNVTVLSVTGAGIVNDVNGDITGLYIVPASGLTLDDTKQIIAYSYDELLQIMSDLSDPDLNSCLKLDSELVKGLRVVYEDVNMPF